MHSDRKFTSALLLLYTCLLNRYAFLSSISRNNPTIYGSWKEHRYPSFVSKKYKYRFLSAINEKSVSRIGIIRNGRELEEM